MHAALLPNDRAVADWEAAIAVVGQRSMTGRDCDENRTALNRLTLSFICDGAEEGERHNRLFSAAANLAEFGCSLQLAHALLTPAALDSGLPIREIERTIQDALTRN